MPVESVIKIPVYNEPDIEECRDVFNTAFIEINRTVDRLKEKGIVQLLTFDINPYVIETQLEWRFEAAHGYISIRLCYQNDTGHSDLRIFSKNCDNADHILFNVSLHHHWQCDTTLIGICRGVVYNSVFGFYVPEED